MASDPRLRSNNFSTILVVEVDSARRLALADILSREGYLVLQAGDVSSAIGVARTHSRPIHLLLMSDSLDPSLPAILRPYRPNMHVVTVANHQIGTASESVLETVRESLGVRRKIARAAGSLGA